MAYERVAIIGTDCISVSLAMGLKAQGSPPEIVGYDREAVKADLARARGAFDRAERKLDRAVRDADLVVVAVPLPALRDTFAGIAPHLKPGCLVTDTARLKVPVMGWAAELLPPSVHFVGGHPVPNLAVVAAKPLGGIEDARADLLKAALYCFTIPSGLPATVIDTLGAWVERLEAQPFFIDAVEHDGLQAGVEDLPGLLTVALLLATVDTPGWQEMRKFAGQRFATATEPVDEAYRQQAVTFLNRESTVLRLNGFLGQLVRLRDLLVRGDAEAVEGLFAHAANARAQWVEERGRGMWGREGLSNLEDVPTPGDRIGRLFFSERLMDRLRKGPGGPRRTS